MSERSSVRFGDTSIEYEVRRSERRKKTVQITVDGGGMQGGRADDDAGERAAGHRAEASALDTEPGVR